MRDGLFAVGNDVDPAPDHLDRAGPFERFEQCGRPITAGQALLGIVGVLLGLPAGQFDSQAITGSGGREDPGDLDALVPQS